MIKVISVDPMDNYKLKIELSDGRKGVFDVLPYVEKGVFRELKDERYFRSVRPAYRGVIWPHEQDFSPETIQCELQEL